MNSFFNFMIGFSVVAGILAIMITIGYLGLLIWDYFDTSQDRSDE